jgi:hypothetical protein
MNELAGLPSAATACITNSRGVNFVDSGERHVAERGGPNFGHLRFGQSRPARSLAMMHKSTVNRLRRIFRNSTPAQMPRIDTRLLVARVEADCSIGTLGSGQDQSNVSSVPSSPLTCDRPISLCHRVRRPKPAVIGSGLRVFRLEPSAKLLGVDWGDRPCHLRMMEHPIHAVNGGNY